MKEIFKIVYFYEPCMRELLNANRINKIIPWIVLEQSNAYEDDHREMVFLMWCY